MINKLVLSGGGVNGILFLGVFKYLTNNNQLKNITTFVGSSIGSVINTLICIGYHYSELEDFIISFDFNTIKDCDISNLFKEYGIDIGRKFEITLNCLIKNKLNIDNITLLEFYKKTKKNNIIITTCLNDKSSCFMNHINYPNLPLITALRMSTCIPFYFSPIIYNNKYYVDGSVLNHFGIKYFNENDKSILGVWLNDTTGIKKIDGLESYILVLIETVLNTVNIKKNKKDNRVILIDNLHNILDFSISKEDKQKLINIGFNKTQEFFKKNN